VPTVDTCEVPNASLKPSDVMDAMQVIDWLRSYVARPYGELGRAGPVCPFVGPALDRDELSIVVYRDDDGGRPERIARLALLHVADLEGQAPGGGAGLLTSVMLVFPGIRPEKSPVLDRVHAMVNHDVVRRGFMIAQFHPTCGVRAARNPNLAVQVGPVPCLALRSMAEHDILFLHDDPVRFHAYADRFWTHFADGRVSDPLLVDRFRHSAEQYGYVAHVRDR
jgi:hypothetical protein